MSAPKPTTAKRRARDAAMRDRLALKFLGRTIVGVEWRPADDGRGETVADPELILDDGRRIGFVVQETDVGEYGIDIVLLAAPRK